MQRGDSAAAARQQRGSSTAAARRNSIAAFHSSVVQVLRSGPSGAPSLTAKTSASAMVRRRGVVDARENRAALGTVGGAASGAGAQALGILLHAI